MNKKRMLYQQHISGEANKVYAYEATSAMQDATMVNIGLTNLPSADELRRQEEERRRREELERRHEDARRNVNIQTAAAVTATAVATENSQLTARAGAIAFTFSLVQHCTERGCHLNR